MRKIGFFVVLFMLLCVYSIDAQESTGSLVGTVRDSSDALIAAADVEVRSLALARSLHTDSNDKGDFVFPDLPPDIYTIRASASGFAAADRPFKQGGA